MGFEPTLDIAWIPKPGLEPGTISLSDNPPLAGILTARQYGLKDILVVSVVESENELIQVCLQVFGADSVIHADDCPFEQAPEAFNAVGVDVSVHERLFVTDSLVLRVGPSSGLEVSLVLIGAEQIGLTADHGIEEHSERVRGEIGYVHSFHPAISLLESDNDLLAVAWSLSALLLAANECVVGFNDPRELVIETAPWLHGLSDLHSHTPSGLVPHVDCALDLFGTDALLGLNHEPDGDKPLLKGRSGCMEDGSRRVGELMSATAALPELAGLDPVGVIGAALWALNTIGPTHLAKKLLALALCREAFLKFDEIHDSSLWDYYITNLMVSQGDKARGS